LAKNSTIKPKGNLVTVELEQPSSPLIKNVQVEQKQPFNVKITAAIKGDGRSVFRYRFAAGRRESNWADFVVNVKDHCGKSIRLRAKDDIIRVNSLSGILPILKNDTFDPNQKRSFTIDGQPRWLKLTSDRSGIVLAGAPLPPGVTTAKFHYTFTEGQTTSNRAKVVLDFSAVLARPPLPTRAPRKNARVKVPLSGGIILPLSEQNFPRKPEQGLPKIVRC